MKKTIFTAMLFALTLTTISTASAQQQRLRIEERPRDNNPGGITEGNQGGEITTRLESRPRLDTRPRLDPPPLPLVTRPRPGQGGQEGSIVIDSGFPTVPLVAPPLTSPFIPTPPLTAAAIVPGEFVDSGTPKLGFQGQFIHNYGMKVLYTNPNSCALRAGLEGGDVILRINGTRITCQDGYNHALRDAIAYHNGRIRMYVKNVRGGHEYGAQQYVTIESWLDGYGPTVIPTYPSQSTCPHSHGTSVRRTY